MRREDALSAIHHEPIHRRTEVEGNAVTSSNRMRYPVRQIDDCRFISHPLVADEVRNGGEVTVRITGELS